MEPIILTLNPDQEVRIKFKDEETSIIVSFLDGNITAESDWADDSGRVDNIYFSSPNVEEVYDDEPFFHIKKGDQYLADNFDDEYAYRLTTDQDEAAFFHDYEAAAFFRDEHVEIMEEMDVLNEGLSEGWEIVPHIEDPVIEEEEPEIELEDNVLLFKRGE